MATDYDDCTGDGLDNDEQRETTEFGCCLPPGDCCMPGLHFPSECHTSDDYDIHHELCISHALERGTLG